MKGGPLLGRKGRLITRKPTRTSLSPPACAPIRQFGYEASDLPLDEYCVAFREEIDCMLRCHQQQVWEERFSRPPPLSPNLAK